ncbi:hypothetical protein ACFW4M_03585 [Streptomyces sp. NPDC058794]|uniref:hypothetical protein n=1 Tax=unclassified Streptomyces TaxID=2593676 RepID=UPI0036C3F2EF
MSDAMIRVPAEVRDRLAAIAEARAERTRAYLAANFGVEVGDEKSAVMGHRLREVFARRG